MRTGLELSTTRKVIYVAGYGRSGSTLLDIALGMHPSIVGAGELTALARHVWRNGEFCACGAPVPECGYWRTVVGRWQDGAGEKGVAEALAWLAAASRRYEGLASPSRIVAARRVPADIAKATKGLFDAIALASGKPEAAVVDSSKLPGRGLVLARTPGIELYVIHLVRDPRAVAFSLAKGYSRDVERGLQKELRAKHASYVALRWMMVNHLAERLCAEVGEGRVMRLRYEDFVADPAAAVASAASLIGFSAAPGEQAQGALRPGHQVAGSRHRMSQAISVRVDAAWERAMDPGSKSLVALLTRAQMKRYNYPFHLDAEPLASTMQKIEV